MIACEIIKIAYFWISRHSWIIIQLIEQRKILPGLTKLKSFKNLTEIVFRTRGAIDEKDGDFVGMKATKCCGGKYLTKYSYTKEYDFKLE